MPRRKPAHIPRLRAPPRPRMPVPAVRRVQSQPAHRHEYMPVPPIHRNIPTHPTRPILPKLPARQRRRQQPARLQHIRHRPRTIQSPRRPPMPAPILIRHPLNPVPRRNRRTHRPRHPRRCHRPPVHQCRPIPPVNRRRLRFRGTSHRKQGQSSSSEQAYREAHHCLAFTRLRESMQAPPRLAAVHLLSTSP